MYDSLNVCRVLVGKKGKAVRACASCRHSAQPDTTYTVLGIKRVLRIVRHVPERKEGVLMARYLGEYIRPKKIFSTMCRPPL